MGVEMTAERENFNAEDQGLTMGSSGIIGSLVAGLFIALLVWGVLHLTHPDTLPIRQVSVEGDFTHLSPEELQALVTNKVRGGFFNVDVDAVRQTLLQEPWVKDVTVKRVWPESLYVTVFEQVPAARWKNQGLLNSTGEYFEPDSASIPAGLPLLSGPSGSESMMLDRLYHMQVETNGIGFDIRSVTQDERRSWQFELSNGIQVILGRHDFEQRFERFLLLAPSVLSGRVEQAASVDMRYTNGLSIKWKEQVEHTASR